MITKKSAENFERAILKADKLSEPSRTKTLHGIIKRRFSKEGFEAAIETIKQKLGRDLTEDDCLAILSSLICPAGK